MTGLPYVEVRTRTQTANGAGRNNFMQNWIAGLNGNSTTSSAGACARAAVGTPADQDSELPITFSACDWQHATGGTTGGGGGSYYPSPVYNGSNAYGYGGAGQPAWPAAAATPPARPRARRSSCVPEPARRGHHAEQLPELERPRAARRLRHPARPPPTRASSSTTRSTGCTPTPATTSRAT